VAMCCGKALTPDVEGVTIAKKGRYEVSQGMQIMLEDVQDLENGYILALPSMWLNTKVINDKMSLVVKDANTTIDSLID